MTIRVEFYSVLRDITGEHEIQVDLPEGTSLSTLLDNLYSRYPDLSQWDQKLLFAADLDYVDRNHLVSADETISIMPPVQGG